MFCPSAGLFASAAGAASAEGLAPVDVAGTATAGSGFVSTVPIGVAAIGGSGFASEFPTGSLFTWEDESPTGSLAGCTGCPQRPSPAQGYSAEVGPFL